jgi:hypothetical protein
MKETFFPVTDFPPLKRGIKGDFKKDKILPKPPLQRRGIKEIQS